jgi:hypothetical protein
MCNRCPVCDRIKDCEDEYCIHCFLEKLSKEGKEKDVSNNKGNEVSE